MEEESQKFIEENINPILEPLVTELIVNRPTSIPTFIINWVNNTYLDLEPSLSVEEHRELESLREEVRKLRAQQPDALKQEAATATDTESSDNEDDYIEELPRPKFAYRGRRFTVSAEAYGKYNKRTEYKPKIIPKTEQQKLRIHEILVQSILFNNLEEKEMDVVIDAMDEMDCEAGRYIISQGDKGDCLYIVESGTLICNKRFGKAKEPTFLREYEASESFGELALLYNTPRAANIIVKSHCKLYKLDRETFNAIVKDNAIKKRKKYEKFLESVPLLQTMSDYERSKIAEALRPQVTKTGGYIIKEGEEGIVFYMLEKGHAYASKVLESGQEPKKLMDYKKGDYFGELALLSGNRRAANIIAKKDCHLLTLDAMCFKRLLGPLENILKRNMDLYEKYTLAAHS